jgi:hypothetical protein
LIVTIGKIGTFTNVELLFKPKNREVKVMGSLITVSLIAVIIIAALTILSVRIILKNRR